jgi:hypothetical protein
LVWFVNSISLVCLNDEIRQEPWFKDSAFIFLKKEKKKADKTAVLNEMEGDRLEVKWSNLLNFSLSLRKYTTVVVEDFNTKHRNDRLK